MHVDGEPQPLAVEADVVLGWARVLVPVDGGERVSGTRLIEGVVTLVRINE